MKILNKQKINNTARVFIVGDLHGQLTKLKEKLASVKFIYGVDYLISVGDLVDRGPEIKQLIDFILETPNCYGVFGNHDNFLLQFDTFPEKWFGDNRNGSETTVAQLGFENLKKYKKKLLSHFTLMLEIEYRDKKIGVVHAGIPMDENKPFKWEKIIKKAKRNKYYRANLIWDRSIIRKIIDNKNLDIPEIKGVDFVVHGHTTLEKPIVFKNRYYIDTFAKNDTLTFLSFDENGEPVII